MLIINSKKGVELTGLHSNFGGLAVLFAEHQSCLNTNTYRKGMTDFKTTSWI
jgi:hypothetical protein